MLSKVQLTDGSVGVYLMSMRWVMIRREVVGVVGCVGSCGRLWGM